MTITITGRQHTGGLWELELEGTRYHGSGASIKSAFDMLLQGMFEAAIVTSLGEAGAGPGPGRCIHWQRLGQCPACLKLLGELRP